MTQSNLDTLSEFLECLRDEVAGWRLDPAPEGDPDTVRYGLYLIAMDVLWSETQGRGGYEHYKTIETPAKLPEVDYREFRRQLEPLAQWLDRLLLAQVHALTQKGMTPIDACETVTTTAQIEMERFLESV